MNWNGDIPESAIVLLEQENLTKIVKRFLSLSGVEKIVVKRNSQEFWAAIQESQFDLILMGWQLYPISGPALFNRIRSKEKYETVPVLAVSSAINEGDFKLLDEFPCSAVCVSQDVSGIQKILFKLWEEKNWYKRNNKQLEKLFKNVDTSPKEVLQELKALMKIAPNPIPLALIIAKLLKIHGLNGPAKSLYKQVLVLDENCVQALNGLGKLLLADGRNNEASVYLRIAWRNSKNNISRLCMLGEIEIGRHDSAIAKEYFHKVLEIDPNDARGNSGMQICENFENFVRNNAGGGLSKNFASICNSIGISLIRSGEFDEGIAQYQASLDILGNKILKSKVMFNIGYAFLRQKKLPEAMEWFVKSKELGGKDFDKQTTFIDKIQSGIIDNMSDAQIGDLGKDAQEEELMAEIDDMNEQVNKKYRSATGEENIFEYSSSQTQGGWFDVDDG